MHETTNEQNVNQMTKIKTEQLNYTITIIKQINNNKSRTYTNETVSWDRIEIKETYYHLSAKQRGVPSQPVFKTGQ